MQDAPAATAAAPQPEETTTTTAAAAAPIITPGVRAGRFQQLFASVVARTLDKIDRDNFAACFPTIRERAPGTLEFVQRQMVERLGGLWNVRREFFFFLYPPFPPVFFPPFFLSSFPEFGGYDEGLFSWDGFA